MGGSRSGKASASVLFATWAAVPGLYFQLDECGTHSTMGVGVGCPAPWEARMQPNGFGKLR